MSGGLNKNKISVLTYLAKKPKPITGSYANNSVKNLKKLNKGVNSVLSNVPVVANNTTNYVSPPPPPVLSNVPVAANNTTSYVSPPPPPIIPRPVTDEDIAFFESVPVVNTWEPHRIKGNTPVDRARYLFDKFAKRMPIEQYEKYIDYVRESSHSYSYEEISKKKIPPKVMSAVKDLFTVEGAYPSVKTTGKCIRICSNTDGDLVDSICFLHQIIDNNTYECIVIGTRQGPGKYSFPLSNAFALESMNHPYNPVELELYYTYIRIRRINKSDIVGLEGGTRAVKVALEWNKLFDPDSKFKVVLEDHATVPCGRLSLLQFLTKPMPRLSWYNSFGFQAELNVDADRLKQCHKRIQELPVSKIANYLKGLLKAPQRSETTWYVISEYNAITLKPSAECESLYEDEVIKAIEAMDGKNTTVKDFFTDSKHCEYLRILPLTQIGNPIAYVDTSLKPIKSDTFPLVADFLYVEPRLGEVRVKKPKAK
jgi:hypothetical protein